jgi:alanine racemase
VIPSIDERLAAAGLPPLPRTAWLEIDLRAVAANVAVLRRLAGPDVAIHAVVKANAYGHGAAQVAEAVVGAGAAGLCVATADEALALRADGIRAPILVLFPVPIGVVPEMVRRRVSITGGDLATLRSTAEAAHLAVGADRAGDETGGGSPGAPRPRRPRLGVHLEVESGLGRGGFDPAELAAAAALVSGAPGLRLEGIWTHMQAPEDEARTAAQLERFDAAAGLLRAAGLRLPARHAAASGGILMGNVASLDAVRPGLAIYGLVPDELLVERDGRLVPRAGGLGDELTPVLSLHARPVRVADLPAGWGIGYGPTFVTQRPSRIATLPVGYGDGLSRTLSNRAGALVRGQRVPLVGNVAMDAVMADVTDVPGAPVSTADEFVLIGRQGRLEITVAEVGRARGTNSWETVTTMAARLPRVYHAPSGALGLQTPVWPPMSQSRRAARNRATRRRTNRS